MHYLFDVKKSKLSVQSRETELSKRNREYNLKTTSLKIIEI